MPLKSRNRRKPSKSEPGVLPSCRIGRRPLYIVGAFSGGVTVLSQQIRALNLVWSVVENRLLDCHVSGPIPKKRKKIAIIGGGFAGLTVAAGLLEKRAIAEITIFEERDTLLPLQQGSDSRWLHPNIYNWPANGSEINVAMLPVLNWTAARASDVAVQILAEWKSVVNRTAQPPSLICNARHIQIQDIPSNPKCLRVEWVGERRDPQDGTMKLDPPNSPAGSSDTFDLVILAVGFGLERDGAKSYWRNEVLGQPSLDKPRRTYLVSGQGDGAMIDLLRLRVSQYRQDRILDELFSGKDILLSAVQALNGKYSSKSRAGGLFNALELLGRPESLTAPEFNDACEKLRFRLRRDTDVILRMRQPSFSGLFNSRTSFQNRLLVYMLYKCGGFSPTSMSEAKILAQYSISEDCIIRRHGTPKKKQFKRLLAPDLFEIFKQKLKRSAFSLDDSQKWRGGYFGFPGPDAGAPGLPNEFKKGWRKEYLPGPTALLASALCSSIVGVLRQTHPTDRRLRVTLHRASILGSEEVLQQACNYQGIRIDPGSTEARTFPASNATIGVAYGCQKIIRSRRGISPEDLRRVMIALNLTYASSDMKHDVGFVLAIPLLEPETNYTAPKPVAGVVYIDSSAEDFYVDDDLLKTLIAIVDSFLNGLTASSADAFGRVQNLPHTGIRKNIVRPQSLSSVAAEALEFVEKIPPPRTIKPFQLNYDHADFAPTQHS